MEQREIGIQGYVRKDGVPVRTHSRRQWLARKLGMRKPPRESLQTLITEPNSLPPKSISDEEFKDLRKAEYEKQGKIAKLLDSVFSDRPVFIWGGGIFATAVSSITVGLTGAVLAAAAAWLVVPVVAYWASAPLTDRYLRRSAEKTSRKIEALNERPSAEYLSAVRAELGEPSAQPWLQRSHDDKSSWWKTLARRKGPISGRVTAYSDGTATLFTEDDGYDPETRKESRFPVMRTTQLYPKMVLRDHEFDSEFNAGYTDLRGADFTGTDFFRASFRSAVLTGANFTSTKAHEMDFTGADVRNVNFENTRLRFARFNNADTTGANFTGAVLKNLHKDNVALTDEQLLSLDPESYLTTQYDQIDFNDAISTLGISDAQFEFLVMSGVIEVRDNEKCKAVTEDYNPSLHHVTDWGIAKARRSLQTNKP